MLHPPPNRVLHLQHHALRCETLCLRLHESNSALFRDYRLFKPREQGLKASDPEPREYFKQPCTGIPRKHDQAEQGPLRKRVRDQWWVYPGQENLLQLHHKQRLHDRPERAMHFFAQPVAFDSQSRQAFSNLRLSRTLLHLLRHQPGISGDSSSGIHICGQKRLPAQSDRELHPEEQAPKGNDLQIQARFSIHHPARCS